MGKKYDKDNFLLWKSISRTATFHRPRGLFFIRFFFLSVSPFFAFEYTTVQTVLGGVGVENWEFD